VRALAYPLYCAHSNPRHYSEEAKDRCYHSATNRSRPCARRSIGSSRPTTSRRAGRGGVDGYLARQFAGDLADLIPAYRDGLDALDATARAAWGRPFADGEPSSQDALLARVETGARGEALVRFFALLVTHTMEGFYGDPDNGGNRGRIAWEMIGFEVRG